MARRRVPPSPFRCFNSSPEVIRASRVAAKSDLPRVLLGAETDVGCAPEADLREGAGTRTLAGAAEEPPLSRVRAG
jgi:hypothetical protein